jgi:hypothetical protein
VAQVDAESVLRQIHCKVEIQEFIQVVLAQQRQFIAAAAAVLELLVMELQDLQVGRVVSILAVQVA